MTVLVELKARFDEENNVHWAKELEQAGCHVIYGVSHLKTHSKITLVVRRKNGKIERFVHLGTGNYNDATAKLYTDFGYITSRKDFGVDATNFFNYLSGYTTKPHFHHLSVAPFDIREQFMDLIDEEIRYHRQYGNGYIIAKMNSLTDKPLIKNVRSITSWSKGRAHCSRNMLPTTWYSNVSENIRVVSVVGRYLEHSRIYYFHHNGEEKIYLSSADLMTRNMEKRVEISFPILDIEMKARIKAILQLILADNVKTREQNKDGDYYYVINGSTEEIDSQVKLFKMAYQNTDAE